MQSESDEGSDSATIRAVALGVADRLLAGEDYAEIAVNLVAQGYSSHDTIRIMNDAVGLANFELAYRQAGNLENFVQQYLPPHRWSPTGGALRALGYSSALGSAVLLTITLIAPLFTEVSAETNEFILGVTAVMLFGGLILAFAAEHWKFRIK